MNNEQDPLSVTDEELDAIDYYINYGHAQINMLCNLNSSNYEEMTNGELRTFIIKLQAKITDASKKNDSYTLAYYLAKNILGITDEKINKLREILMEK